MSDEESTDGNEWPLTRRQAIGTGVTSAVALAGLTGVSGSASASNTEPRIQIGSDYEIDDDTGGLFIEHQPTTDKIHYDSTNNQWVIDKPSLGTLQAALDVGSNNINNAGTVNASTVSTTDLTATNARIWQEDANSPFTVSGASSGTYTLDGTYDNVSVQVVSSSGAELIDMTVNGDTGSNYHFRDTSGTRTTSASELSGALWAGQAAATELRLAGRWASTDGRFTIGAIQSREFDGLVSGQNGSISSPLNQFTISSDSGNNFDLTARVYGID